MKVYAVEFGEYSDRYVACLFTTRELAEEYVIERARRGWIGTRIEWPTPTWEERVERRWTLRGPAYDGSAPSPREARHSPEVKEVPFPFPERRDFATFDEWLEAAGGGRDVGYVQEYDLWDAVPIADLAEVHH